MEVAVLLGDLAVALPPWAVAVVLLLPVLDFLHSLTPWSRRLWTDFDHRAWSRFWSVTTTIRWTQAGVAVAVLALADVPLAAVGVRLPSPAVTMVSVAAAVGITAWYVYAAATEPSIPVADAPTDFTTTYPADRRERALWFVSGGVTAGVCEEFVYRGVALGALLGLGVPWPVAVLGAAVAFAATHGLAVLNPVALAFYVAFALVMTAVVALSGSLLPAVVLHGAVNLWEVIGSFRDDDLPPDADTAAA
ncbi:MAG: lysostaphin resistance A-like protein [Halobacterium sp.]